VLGKPGTVSFYVDHDDERAADSAIIENKDSSSHPQVRDTRFTLTATSRSIKCRCSQVVCFQQHSRDVTERKTIMEDALGCIAKKRSGD
jgi:hypothetical protein